MRVRALMKETSAVGVGFSRNFVSVSLPSQSANSFYPRL